jgi:hypothetical protein
MSRPVPQPGPCCNIYKLRAFLRNKRWVILLLNVDIFYKVTAFSGWGQRDNKDPLQLAETHTRWKFYDAFAPLNI